ncbi:BatD family protein [Chryseobacterium gambrini]|uniref:BatD family protein n=1 Tax=Chryseobacterium gambrini TaxID=373672 RepID=A0AAJ1VP19_9FLAO|nr:MULTISPECIES: BatD family protein [Chryseobacterium]MDN4014494.1 BatD family protein [Chryseobacterium gambrini]MDN4031531.1 BatD family protein [Chryseobacterium gambrini]QWA38399.1 BatD family protein [Chryseobacterium sp. ZHDP1]
MQNRIIYILLLMSSVISYGQVNLSVTPDKTTYNGKEIVNLNIVLEMNGGEYNQQTPLRSPDLSKFNIIGSGSASNGYVDPETNTVISQSITRLALEPKQKGKVKIGSFLITINNKIYKTEPFDIFIKDVEKKPVTVNNASKDVYLNMEIDDREVYQDQPTIAVLKVYSKNMDNFRRVRNIHLPEQDNLDVFPVSFTKSEIDPSDAGNMASQILAVFMVFPNEAGYVDIPGVSASLNSYANKNKLVSNKVKINVKKLPEGSPECFKNAVGNFNVTVVNTSKEKIEVKKPMNVLVKVSGEGNLKSMELPKIAQSPDYEVFAPKIISRVTVGTEGMKGEVLANYLVIPKKAGEINIKTEQFAFFDPSSKEYVDLGQQSLAVNAFSHDQILESRTAVEKVNEYTNTFLETVNTPVLKTTSFKVKEKKKFHWNVLFINIAILLSLFGMYLLFKTWQKKNRLSKEIQAPMPLGSVAETENEIREKFKTDINDYFGYLENLKDNEDYQKFFQTFDELDQEVKNQYSGNPADHLTDLLEKEKGSSIAEEYRNLIQRVQVEKYAPIKSSEGMDELLSSIVNLYSKISK